MKFDPQIHDRRSIRLRDFDYSAPGEYFITIVAYQRECLFGEIAEGDVQLNRFGLVAKEQWTKLIQRFPHNELGACVVMPNQIQSIINIIEKSRRGTVEVIKDFGEDSSRRAPTTQQFQKPIKGSLPTIIRSYKSAVTKRINLMRGGTELEVWQRNYYDHVIRDPDDLNRISRYIESNPSAWEADEENPHIPHVGP